VGCGLKMEALQRNLHVQVSCLKSQFQSRIALPSGWAIPCRPAKVRVSILNRNKSSVVYHCCSCLDCSQLLTKQLQKGRMATASTVVLQVLAAIFIAGLIVMFMRRSPALMWVLSCFKVTV
jgi:hypothetical protein